MSELTYRDIKLALGAFAQEVGGAMRELDEAVREYMRLEAAMGAVEKKIRDGQQDRLRMEAELKQLPRQYGENLRELREEHVALKTPEGTMARGLRYGQEDYDAGRGGRYAEMYTDWLKLCAALDQQFPHATSSLRREYEDRIKVAVEDIDYLDVEIQEWRQESKDFQLGMKDLAEVHGVALLDALRAHRASSRVSNKIKTAPRKVEREPEPEPELEIGSWLQDLHKALDDAQVSFRACVPTRKANAARVVLKTGQVEVIAMRKDWYGAVVQLGAKYA